MSSLADCIIIEVDICSRVGSILLVVVDDKHYGVVGWDMIFSMEQMARNKSSLM